MRPKINTEKIVDSKQMFENRRKREMGVTSGTGETTTLTNRSRNTSRWDLS